MTAYENPHCFPTCTLTSRAFTSVIEDASRRGGFSEIWSLGDLLGYGPDPVECLRALDDYEHKAVAGNHDLAAARAAEPGGVQPVRGGGEPVDGGAVDAGAGASHRRVAA